MLFQRRTPEQLAEDIEMWADYTAKAVGEMAVLERTKHPCLVRGLSYVAASGLAPLGRDTGQVRVGIPELVCKDAKAILVHVMGIEARASVVTERELLQNPQLLDE